MKSKFTILVLVATLFLVPASVWSQQADSLAELGRRIDILTEEIERLKLGAVDETTYESFGGLGPAASKIYSLKTSGVSLAGYGEMLYQNFSSQRDNNTPSTSTDRIDFYRNILYVGYRFNDWVLFNSEIEVEHGSTGKGGVVSVEFGYIDLMLSRSVNVRAGMVLVPVGIVNEKHEPPTFFGTDRASVEKLIIPSTWRTNGAGVFGRIGDAIDYRAYIVESLRMDKFSSSGIRGGRQSGAQAIAEDLALTGRIEYSGLRGAIVGASLFAGNTGQGEKDSLGSEISARTMVLSVHGEYVYKSLELRGLFARTSLDEAARVAGYLRWKSGAASASPIGSVQSGWYVTAGYDILPLLMSGSGQYLAPFVQYESVNVHAEVPAGFTANPAFDQSTLVVGLTWKPHPNVAFKADYRDNKNGATTATDQFNFAVTYMY